MKQTKKTIAVSAIIAALFLVSGIRGCAAAVPSWLPSSTQLAGYTMVWNNSISVQWITDKDSNGNVTCSSQVWLKNGTSGIANANVIGASMIDKGGDVLNKGVDLSKNDIGTIAAKVLLTGAGLNQSQIEGIRNVWDIVVEILRVNQGTSYNLTEPVVPNVDNAVMLEFAPSNNFTYVLFCTRQDHCMVVYSFNASQDWIDWLNATGTGGLILARMQVITWAFWIILATYVAVIVGLANFLGVSDAPAAVAESAVPASSASSAIHASAIHTSAFTPTSDLTAFAAAWGALFPNFPWWIVIVVVAGAVVAVVIIAVLVRKRKNK
jgi:hypothetical protein